MRKRMQQYYARIERLLHNPSPDLDWEDLMEDHLRQIAFFQHERLAHLIVTMTFALLTLLSVGIALASANLTMLLLTAALVVLLIPYILHYYFLENNVQRMYVQYDQILVHVQETKRTMAQAAAGSK